MPIENQLLGYRASWDRYSAHLLNGRTAPGDLFTHVHAAVKECELTAGCSLSWTRHGEAWKPDEELGFATLIGYHPAYRPFVKASSTLDFLPEDHPTRVAYAATIEKYGERVSILFEVVPEYRSWPVDYPDAKRPFRGSRFYAHKVEGAREIWEVVDGETDECSISTTRFDTWAKEVGIINPLFVSTEDDALAVAAALHYGAQISSLKLEAKIFVDKLSTETRKGISALKRRSWLLDHGALLYVVGFVLLVGIVVLVW